MIIYKMAKNKLKNRTINQKNKNNEIQTEPDLD